MIHQTDENSYMTSHFTPKERAPFTQRRLGGPQSWYKQCEETQSPAAGRKQTMITLSSGL